MIVLAHRGSWVDRAEANSLGALRAAFAAGHGVETDIRDHDGVLVIAHDPPTGPGLTPFTDVLRAYVEAGAPGAFAINVKADGLQPAIGKALAEAGVGNAFVFDMSVPDGLRYLREGVRTFTRQSEYEPEPPFYEAAAGVWMDCFERDWIRPEAIAGHVAAGKAVALVSPELHGRPHRAVWHAWAEVRALPSVMICTDHPDEAKAMLG
jgi:hypothetical protein